jgi:L-threonylcarbamoyladenylate synthase
METIIRKIDKNQINQDVIEEAGNVLKQGGLVAFPTETVYGLGADALKEEAAKKTYAAKGRPSDNPLKSGGEYSTGDRRTGSTFLARSADDDI